MKFNEAVKKHKNNLIENLSKFHEGHRLNGMLRDIDSSYSDYEYYFNAGAASRQAEIDELQKRLAMYEREGYKLVPVEATDAQWEAAIDAYSIAMDGKDILSASAFYDIYEAMIGAVE